MVIDIHIMHADCTKKMNCVNVHGLSCMSHIYNSAVIIDGISVHSQMARAHSHLEWVLQA